MNVPIFVRPLRDLERKKLKAGLRSSQAFTMRRCQILLASSRKERVSQIAATVGCCKQTVRNAIRDFNDRGVICVRAQSKRPKTVKPVLDQDKSELLKAVLHESPRKFGKPRSTWTLDLIGEVCWETGLTSNRLTLETIRIALKRLKINWKRAKHWITSPDPQYALKKRDETA